MVEFRKLTLDDFAYERTELLASETTWPDRSKTLVVVLNFVSEEMFFRVVEKGVSGVRIYYTLEEAIEYYNSI